MSRPSLPPTPPACLNRYHSYNLSSLPDGCLQCVRGEKLVLFVTGLCPRSCYFCPLSDQKYGHDVCYANEREISSSSDILIEARSMGAKGCGITGGDPLLRLDRTTEYIRLLKDEFGPSFHVHLYSSLNLVTVSTLHKLFTAGLDEIRFHLDIDNTRFYHRLSLARAHPWKIGVEIPSLPHKFKQIKYIAGFIADKVDFLNLNELERADNSLSRLDEMGFTTTGPYSYAERGSVELGLKIIDYIKSCSYTYSVHLCTAKLKDSIQLAERFKNQGRLSARSFDTVSKDGLLTRAAIYLPELSPGISYHSKLANAPRLSLLSRLSHIHHELSRELSLSSDDLVIDTNKLRLLLSTKNARRYRAKIKKHSLSLAIVTELPTADALEIEVSFL